MVFAECAFVDCYALSHLYLRWCLDLLYFVPLCPYYTFMHILGNMTSTKVSSHFSLFNKDDLILCFLSFLCIRIAWSCALNMVSLGLLFIIILSTAPTWDPAYQVLDFAEVCFSDLNTEVIIPMHKLLKS